MGFPRKVEPRPPPAQPAGGGTAAQLAATGAAAPAAPPPAQSRAASAAAAAARRARAAGAAETLKSRCPIKWTSHEAAPAASAYSEAFGARAAAAAAAGGGGALAPARPERATFPEVSGAWGHVSEVRHPPAGGAAAAYPVPLRCVEAPRALGERPGEEDFKTTNRMSYAPM